MPTNPRAAGDLKAALDESFGAGAPAAVRIAQHESNGETPKIAGPIQGQPRPPVSFIDRAYADLEPGHFAELERLVNAAGELYGDALRDRLRRELALLADHLTDARAHLAYARRERACDLDDIARSRAELDHARTLLDHHRAVIRLADYLADVSLRGDNRGAAEAYLAARNALPVTA